MHHLDREGLDLQVDAGYLRAALLGMVAGALAEFGKADMPVLAQFQAGGDQYAVYIYTCLTLKLEEHRDRAGFVRSTAEHPTAATENGTGEGLDQAARLLDGDRLHLQCPGNTDCAFCV